MNPTDAEVRAVAEALADSRMASWDHLTAAELKKYRPRQIAEEMRRARAAICALDAVRAGREHEAV